MRLTQCAAGHYYDADWHSSCPICANGPGTIEFSEEMALQAQQNRENAGEVWEAQPIDLRQCDYGHMYDANQHTSCPACGEPITERTPDFTYNDWERWEHEPQLVKCAKGHSYNNPVYGSRCPVCHNEEIIDERSWSNYFADRSPDKVWLTTSEQEVLDDMPICWKACLVTDGRKKSFAVDDGLNAIGRGAGNHIVIRDDEAVAFKEHAFILCDSDRKTYYLINGRMGGETRIHDRRIGKGAAVALADGDRICIGNTHMVFFADAFPSR